MLIHPIPPVFDENSEILILGSFPSVKSREEGFFYGHKQNRFWRVVSAVLGVSVPVTIEEKRQMLTTGHIALWDVIKSCEIDGSSDCTIRNVTPNDISLILDKSQIRKIFVNGKTAEKFYKRYTEHEIKRPAICLPSTSPANAAWTLDGLIREWNKIKID